VFNAHIVRISTLNHGLFIDKLINDQPAFFTKLDKLLDGFGFGLYVMTGVLNYWGELNHLL
jgi:hypothetical protein